MKQRSVRCSWQKSDNQRRKSLDSSPLPPIRVAFFQHRNICLKGNTGTAPFFKLKIILLFQSTAAQFLFQQPKLTRGFRDQHALAKYKFIPSPKDFSKSSQHPNSKFQAKTKLGNPQNTQHKLEISLFPQPSLLTLPGIQKKGRHFVCNAQDSLSTFPLFL